MKMLKNKQYCTFKNCYLSTDFENKINKTSRGEKSDNINFTNKKSFALSQITSTLSSTIIRVKVQIRFNINFTVV